MSVLAMTNNMDEIATGSHMSVLAMTNNIVEIITGRHACHPSQ